MWQRFTKRARKVVFYAQEEAVAHGRTDVASEHLLLGLLRVVMAEKDVLAEKTVWPPAPTDKIDWQEIAAVILYDADVDLEQLWAKMQHQVTLLNLPTGKDVNKIALTPSAKRVIDLMYDEARRASVKSMTPEFLLLALIRDDKGTTGRVLAEFGLEITTARKKVASIYWPVEENKPVKPSFWSHLFAKHFVIGRDEKNIP